MLNGFVIKQDSNITTYIPDGKNGANYPEAYGHFTFGNDTTHLIFKEPYIY